MSKAVTTPSIGERLRASSLHLLLSLLVLAATLYLVFGLWYPAPLHIAMGVSEIFLLLLGIDLLLGPLLTAVVFKYDRRHFLKDLAVILILQLSALAYGVYTVAQGRPVWLAFVVDDVEIIRAIDVRPTKEPVVPEHQASLWSAPRWVAAVYSADPKVRQQQMQDEILEGISLARRPETYQPLDERLQQIAAKQKNLTELTRFNTPAATAAVLATHADAKAWLPVKAPQHDMVVLLDKTARPLAIVDLRPW